MYDWIVEMELTIEEAIVLHEFARRELSKTRSMIGDRAEKTSLLSLFTNLESHLLGRGVLGKSRDRKLKEAKELLTNSDLMHKICAKRAWIIHERQKEENSG